MESHPICSGDIPIWSLGHTLAAEAFEPFVLCPPKTAEENLLTDSVTEEELKRFPFFAALTISRS
jgi:hypothetical protein